MSFDDHHHMIPLDPEQIIIIHGSDDDDDDDLSSEEFDEEETIASPLNDMSTLLRQLPVKRGLSKHYDGKSQSFTSLSNVKCLEDLPKVENSYNKKKLKSCRSYGGLLLCAAQNQPPAATAAGNMSTGSNCSGQGYIGSSNGSRPPPIARSRTSSSIYSGGGALLFA